MIDIEKLAKDAGAYSTDTAKEVYLQNDEYIFIKNSLINFAEAYAAKALEEKEREITRLTFISTTLKDNIDELQAHGNDLREAFRKIRSCYGDGYEVDNIARQALSKTPAQSLQAFENEVIEMCAKVSDGYVVSNIPSNKIRALKGNHDGT